MNRRFHPPPIRLLIALPLLAVVWGCSPGGAEAVRLAPVAGLEAAGAGEVHLAGAGNEWLGFAVRLEGNPSAGPVVIRLPEWGRWEVYRVVEVLSERPDYEAVRMGREGDLPGSSALVPLRRRGRELRLGGGEDLVLWLDLHLTREMAAGQYLGAVELVRGPSVGSLPVGVTVHDLEIPPARGMVMALSMDWEELGELFAELREVDPRLLERSDHGGGPAVRRLDQLMSLAQEHRLQLVIDGLEPTVKWRPLPDPRQGLEIDWTEFDSLMRPWMSGEAFGDGVGLAGWPVPRVELIEQLDASIGEHYLRRVDGHFSRRLWTLLSLEEAIDAGGLSDPSDLRRLAWKSALAGDWLLRVDTDPAWFYAGDWFGVDGPVPTVRLKRLRRAQQDAERVRLAMDDRENSHLLEEAAEMLLRPVLVPPEVGFDPMHELLSGPVEEAAWAQGLRILASPGPRTEIGGMRTPPWRAVRPLMLPRRADWRLNDQREISLGLEIDLYSAMAPPEQGWRLGWWRQQPVEVAAGERYVVQRVLLPRTDVALDSSPQQHIELVDGYTGWTYGLAARLPVGVSRPVRGPVRLDGSLEEWSAADAVHEGRLLRLMDRAAVQRQRFDEAAHESAVYTAWDAEHFFVAFRVEGVFPPSKWWRNFVEYRGDRAWGEELCQIVIAPLAREEVVARPLHVVCKPRGQWIERLDADGQWRAEAGSAVRYASTLHEGVWRGEVAIPWSALLAEGQGELPAALRFNFAQHRHETGETATWAGPADTGREVNLAGLIVLIDQQ